MDSVKWFEAVRKLAKERGTTYQQASKEMDTMAKYICGGAMDELKGARKNVQAEFPSVAH